MGRVTPQLFVPAAWRPGVVFMLHGMSRTVDEIREALDAIASTWSNAATSERGAAQSFLNELVRAYTGQTVIEAGGEFERPVKRDEGRGFMDMIWDDVVLIEMKAPKETPRLDQHRAQLLDYWRNSADPEQQRAAPPYAILCSFDKFEVWEPGKYPNGPVDTFPLEELADHAESLLFLAGKKPVYGGPGAAVTREAAEHMVALYFQLVDREAASTDELHRWVMQTVWALFAEDLGLLQERPLETLIQALIGDGTRSTIIELADLYRRLNTPDDATRNRARPTPVPYVNGELFAAPAEVHLERDELEHLLAACRFDWRYVNPTVFGALMEGCLGHERRWELGAHYTSEEDILSIVRPVIVHPWVERIESVESPADAVAMVTELTEYRVLDPAMGCGNFLSIAYRELRALERLAHEKTTKLHHDAGLQAPLLPRYPIDNLYGIEIDAFAVEIAKVTLWMTHAIETRKYQASAENPLPLHPLTHLVCADSLKADWPDVEAIIGNPPFHGSQRLRGVLGDEYMSWLQDHFGVGVQDHCVFFFLKAEEEMDPGERAGLVATNTISQNRARTASLDKIVADGGVIFDATSTKVWSGDAAVHVSIVCWEKQPAGSLAKRLDGVPVEDITTSLKPEVTRIAHRLEANANKCFQGFNLVGTGFLVTPEQAQDLLDDPTVDYSKVLFPFINGEDLARRPLQDSDRWVIDFADWPLDEAMRYPRALDVVREHVKPMRDENRRDRYRDYWWQLGENRPKIRKTVFRLDRYPTCGQTGKWLTFTWKTPDVRMSHACYLVAVDDDHSFGVITSRFHDIWARHNSSTLKGDLRYTPSTAFETFVFPPSPSLVIRERVATAARRIVDLRCKYCLEQNIGLTKLYNLMDDGGATDLRDAHRELDEAVAAAYGWDASMLDSDAAILDALYDLNAEIANGAPYDPFGSGASD